MPNDPYLSTDQNSHCRLTRSCVVSSPTGSLVLCNAHADSLDAVEVNTSEAVCACCEAEYVAELAMQERGIH